MKSADLRLLLSWGGSRKLLLVTFSAAIFNTVIVIANGFFIARVVIDVIRTSDRAISSILWLAFLLSVRSLINPTVERWCATKALEFKAELRNELTAQIAVLDDRSATHLSTLLIKGLNSLDIYLGKFLPQMASASITPIAVLTTIFILDPLAGFIAIATVPLIPLFGALIGKYTEDSVTKKWKALGTLGAYFEDSLRGFITLSIFGRQKSQSKRIKEMGDSYTQETMKVLRISFLSALVLELVATISVALIAVSIGIRLVEAQIPFSKALTILVLAPEVYFPLRSAASLFHASADGSAVLKECRELLETISDEQLFTEERIALAEGISWPEWHLQFTGARVGAEGVKPGESLAISGPSGVGKTTFLRWILHTYEIDSIGFISQNPSFAPGSIREQFKYLDSEISDQQIFDSLSQVGLHSAHLSSGLDTFVGGGSEKGSALSGGQLRKVAVARALLQNPKVIVADEPTADLDSESAQEVVKLIFEAVDGGAALVVVSHDSVILDRADRCIQVEVTSDE